VVLWSVRVYLCHFFFSSRRRHTRSKRDWSSDVCSSDLTLLLSSSTGFTKVYSGEPSARTTTKSATDPALKVMVPRIVSVNDRSRSEERRVGKEGGGGGRGRAGRRTRREDR